MFKKFIIVLLFISLSSCAYITPTIGGEGSGFGDVEFGVGISVDF
jgi:hypothetical protein